jgi:hypothetical protein
MVVKKVFGLMCALALMVGSFYLVPTSVDAGSDNGLAVLLPASDGVVVLDSKRLINTELPTILDSNPTLMNKINNEVDKIKTKAGLDLRSFDSVAIGLKNIVGEDGAAEFDAVVLARGSVPTDSLKKVAKTASKDNFKTIKFSNRSIYVFSADDLIKTNPDKASFIEKTFGKLFKSLSKEVALTAVDSNTVAFGSLARVKETISDTPRISTELLAMAARKPGALANLGIMLPTGIARFIDLEDDDLGDSLKAIRKMQASLDVIEGATGISVAATAVDTDQAEGISLLLQSMQRLFAGILKDNSGADKQAYARMLESLKVTQQDQDVFMDLIVPKSDLDIIIGK